MTKRIVLLVFLIGCASSLTKAGREVNIIPSPAPYDCERLESFKADHSSGTATSVALRNFEAEIKNNAGRQGANYVSVAPAGRFGTRQKVVAMGLKCEAESVGMHYACLSGNAVACVEYSKLLEVRGLKQGQLAAAESACQLKFSFGCLLAGKERAQALKQARECDEGVYASCGLLGKQVLKLKDPLGALYFYRLACEGGSHEYCSQAGRLAQVEAEELRRRKEEERLRAQENLQYAQGMFSTLFMMDQFWNSRQEQRQPSSHPTRCVSEPVYMYGEYQRTETNCN